MLKILLSTSFILLFACSFSVYAQNNKNEGSSENLFKEKPFDRGATYGNAAVESKNTRQKKRDKKKGFSIDYDEKKKEYDKRMKKNARKYMKMEREMKKPQYSDPTYFGHKKKPKKRKPGKKKFCKECGLTH